MGGPRVRHLVGDHQPSNAAHVVHNTGTFFSEAASELQAFITVAWPTLAAEAGALAALAIGWVLARRLASRLRGRSWAPVMTGFLTARTTTLAARLAGHRHQHAKDEWQSDLRELSERASHEQAALRYASGLLRAAIMYRVHDAAELTGRLVDAILTSRMLSNIAMSVPTLAAAMVLIRHSGAYGLVSSAGSLVVIGGILYGAIRRGRSWRDVTPPDRKPPHVHSAEDRRGAARVLAGQATSQVGRVAEREPVVRAVLKWVTRERLDRGHTWPSVPMRGTPWQDTVSAEHTGWRQRAACLDGAVVFAVDYQICRRCRLGWVEQPHTVPEFQRCGIAAAGLGALRAEHPGLKWHTLNGHSRDSEPFWATVSAGVTGGYQQRDICPHRGGG